MARITQSPHHFSRGISSTLTLASSRWRQHWLLLLVITLGMIASITLVCTLPLLSEVLQTASLRSTLSATPQNAELAAHLTSSGLSNQTIETFFPTIDSAFQNNLKSYLSGSPRLEVQTPNFTFLSPQLPFTNQMTIDATSMALSASHVTLVQGRLPLANSSDVEIALTPEAAQIIGVKLNDFITLQLSFVARTSSLPTATLVPTHQALTLHVVGLFHVIAGDAFWHGADFLPQLPQSDAVPLTLFTALASSQSLLATLDHIAVTHYEPQAQVIFTSVSFLTWYYQLNPSSISINQLDDLINRLNAVQTYVANNFNFSGISVALSGLPFHSPTQSSLLEQFRTQLSTARVPVGIFAALIVCLLLFFVGVMILLLIDRQAETIIVLRSRGASNAQIFISMLTQCIGLGIIALLAGLLFTPLTLLPIARLFLSAGDQGALNVVMHAPAQAVWGVRYYALITALIAVIVMSLSLLSVSRLNLMTSGRTRYPLWRRLNLDLFAALIALVGYGLSLYFGSIQQQLDNQTQLLLAGPVAFIGPFFLLIAAILLLLRIFPWLLRLGASIAMRGRGATPLLALAQISRAPRKSLRMILLLALTLAFAFFTLVFAASEGQRANNIAAYEVGADFSGAIPIDSYVYAPQKEIALYHSIPGVLSASTGFEEEGSAVQVPPYAPLLLRAVDPGTYATAATWTAQDATQFLSSLMAQLLARRNTAIAHDYIPAIIDRALSNEYPLHIGSTFAVFPDASHQANTLVGHLHYMVIAMVDHIPGIDESVEGGVLVDYQTFAAIEARDGGENGVNIASNHIWLHTSDDPTVVHTIHTILTSSNLRLAYLSDRYALVDALLSDPTYLNLISVLAFGVTAAFLLALFANLLASWLSARSRLTSFVVLRALGTSMRGISSVFLWEQGIVYASALLLGILFGVLLAITLVPALLFTGVPPAATVVNGNVINFSTLQHIIPIQVVLPSTLVIALLVFIAICAIALGMMVSLALRRSIGRELRLNDDAQLDFATREVVTAPPRSRAKPARRRRASLSTGSSTLRLTFLQIRRARLLTFLAGVTMIVAVGIMCLIPLYSSITINGGLHS
ncbi:MAG TPA: FtsX-like permease family protein, partial [Ktedonobacteraceae bacterium]|nr:FtsX-like permease family protein [Ktedonobacteraceae bacterium]